MRLTKIKLLLTSAKQNATHITDDKNVTTTNYQNQDTAECYNYRKDVRSELDSHCP